MAKEKKITGADEVRRAWPLGTVHQTGCYTCGAKGEITIAGKAPRDDKFHWIQKKDCVSTERHGRCKVWSSAGTATSDTHARRRG